MPIELEPRSSTKPATRPASATGRCSPRSARMRRCLEYGCGTGSAAFDLAAEASTSTGIDISPVAIEARRVRGSRPRGVRTSRFGVMNAEPLDLPDRSLRCGVRLGGAAPPRAASASSEVARVLAPGGWAAFVEPLGHNPFINAYRRRTPEMRTPDEHPLRRRGLRHGREHRFELVEVDYFNLLTLRERPAAAVLVQWPIERVVAPRRSVAVRAGPAAAAARVGGRGPRSRVPGLLEMSMQQADADPVVRSEALT